MNISWISTKIGLRMAEVIVKYLPRITVCLAEIALSLKDKSQEVKNNVSR